RHVEEVALERPVRLAGRDQRGLCEKEDGYDDGDGRKRTLRRRAWKTVGASCPRACRNWYAQEAAKRSGSASRRARARMERRTAAGAAVVGTALIEGVSAPTS